MNKKHVTSTVFWPSKILGTFAPRKPKLMTDAGRKHFDKMLADPAISPKLYKYIINRTLK